MSGKHASGHGQPETQRYDSHRPTQRATRPRRQRRVAYFLTTIITKLTVCAVVAAMWTIRIIAPTKIAHWARLWASVALRGVALIHGHWVCILDGTDEGSRHADATLILSMANIYADEACWQAMHATLAFAKEDRAHIVVWKIHDAMEYEPLQPYFHRPQAPPLGTNRLRWLAAASGLLGKLPQWKLPLRGACALSTATFALGAWLHSSVPLAINEAGRVVPQAPDSTAGPTPAPKPARKPMKRSPPGHRGDPAHNLRAR